MPHTISQRFGRTALSQFSCNTIFYTVVDSEDIKHMSKKYAIIKIAAKTNTLINNYINKCAFMKEWLFLKILNMTCLNYFTLLLFLTCMFARSF